MFSVPTHTKKFDERETDTLSSELQRWQNVSLTILQKNLPKDSMYITNFEETISEKKFGYNPKRGMKNEVRRGLDTIKSVYEALLCGLLQPVEVKQEITLAELSETESQDTVKVFISHASVEKSVIKPFVEKVLQLGLGLNIQDIAFTSEESFGVEPGDSIAKYIKENIIGAKVVLVMLSKNYKASEVCLNEMGAAWALGKKCISVVLPGTGFEQLGWLMNLDKAVQMTNKKQLFRLCQTMAKLLSIDLNERFTAINSNIEDFIAEITTAKQTISVEKTKDNDNAEVKKIQPTESLRIFDAEFTSICLTEGEYIMQLNVRMRSESEPISIKRVFLTNATPFFGSTDKPKKKMEFKTYIHQGKFELNDEVRQLLGFIKNDYPKLCQSLLDMTIERGHTTSMSFVQYFETIRESDGNEDLQLSGWNLVAQYNVDGEVVIPLTLNPIDLKNHRGFYWDNR